MIIRIFFISDEACLHLSIIICKFSDFLLISLLCSALIFVSARKFNKV